MSILSIVNSVHEISERYRSVHAMLDPENFKVRPSADAWSLAEIYHHAFDSSILSLEAVESLGEGADDGGEATLVGKAILFTGVFPPGIKFKAPGRLLARLQVIEHMDTAELIRIFEEKFESAIAIGEKADARLRKKHPRLGYFNAEQWLRFTEIHLKHHLKQAERTAAFFNKK